MIHVNNKTAVRFFDKREEFEIMFRIERKKQLKKLINK
jgi:hypothetical protein